MNPPRPVDLEAGIQLLLMLGVGSVAAYASWSHVVDLATRHGQPGWLAVADAAVLETMAVSMGLEVRRRRREHVSAAFAVAVLGAAVVLQLSAQVAQAQRTFWGWTMAALPAIGFLVLAKAALTRDHQVPAAGEGRAAVAVAVAKSVADTPIREMESGPQGTPAPLAQRTARRTTLSDEVVLRASHEVAAVLAVAGTPLTRAALAKGLRDRGVAVGTSRVSAALAAVRRDSTPIPGTQAARAGSADGDQRTMPLRSVGGI